MIKAKDYYSDVYDEKDNVLLQCGKCKSLFKLGDSLLNIPEKDDYDEDEITEHCPVCKAII